MHWYTDVLKKYTVFSGRATRSEYWWFTLISTIIVVAIYSVVLAAGGSFGNGQAVGNLYQLAVLLPSIGVAIRRLHDTDHSGWWILIGLIPLVGWVWIIVLLATGSDPGLNRYGPNPLAGPEPLYDAPAARFDTQTGEPLQPPPTSPPS
jgi:uncharacterized membrane protein YhaH (DUF805 family)